MAIIGAVGVVGVVGVVSIVSYSDLGYGNHSDYSDYRDYSDHAERERRIHENKKNELKNMTEETQDHVKNAIIDFSDETNINLDGELSAYGDSANKIEKLVENADKKIVTVVDSKVSDDENYGEEIKKAKSEIDDINKLIARINEIKLGNGN